MNRWQRKKIMFDILHLFFLRDTILFLSSSSSSSFFRFILCYTDKHLCRHWHWSIRLIVWWYWFMYSSFLLKTSSRKRRKKKNGSLISIENGEKMRRGIKDEKYPQNYSSRVFLSYIPIESSEYSNDASFDFKDWRMKIKYSFTVWSTVWKWSDDDKLQSILNRTGCSFQGHRSIWHWQCCLLMIEYFRLSCSNNPSWECYAQRMFLID